VSDGRTSARRAAVDIAVYAAARLLLVAVLSVVIYTVGRLLGVRDFPPIVAVLFALVIALPLGIWVFAPLRRRATASVEDISARRHRDREQLRARLRGDELPDGQ
jgi:type VI protein secretion system component VasK